MLVHVVLLSYELFVIIYIIEIHSTFIKNKLWDNLYYTTISSNFGLFLPNITGGSKHTDGGVYANEIIMVQYLVVKYEMLLLKSKYF